MVLHHHSEKVSKGGVSLHSSLFYSYYFILRKIHIQYPVNTIKEYINE